MTISDPALRVCPACGGSLSAEGGCRRCAMAGALEALDQVSEEEAEPGEGVAASNPGFAAFAPPQLPWRFANFEVRREIASGGMGTVYEAEDLRLGRSVALKMIRAFVFSTKEEKLRFRAEAEAAAALDHPHIVPIYHVGEIEEQPYFTMKLMEGGTLATLLQKGPLPPRTAAELMSKIACAVHHAHERGILHRDLKPGNILLDVQGEPYLTDFGLAKHADNDHLLTVSRAQVGTLPYMSPEQTAGRTREISTRSDVWALGAMLYEMLSGRLPFQGESSVEVMRQILEQEPPSLHSRLSGLNGTDRDLSTIVSRCLEKDPARRPHSAEILTEELERWLRGEPILSRPISAGERWWKWARRHKTASASIAFASLALIGGTVVSVWQAARATAAQKSAEHHAAESQRQAVSASAARLETERQLAEAEAITKVITDTLADMENFSSGPTIDRQQLAKELIKSVEGLSGSPVRKARLFAALGKTLPDEEGMKVLLRAVALVESAVDSNEPLLWDFRLQVARKRGFVQESRDEAIKEMRRIAAWTRAHLPREAPNRLTANGVLGRYLSLSGDKEEAKEAAGLLKEVHDILHSRPEDYDLHNQIMFRSDYARALFTMGRREEALAMGRESMRLVPDAKKRAPLAAARGALAQAELCQKARLLDESASAAEEALKLYWQEGGPLASSSERALSFLLAVHREIGEPDRLVAVHQAATREFDRKLGFLHPKTAAQVRDYARALVAANRKPEADALCVDWLKRVRSPDGSLPGQFEGILRAHTEVLRLGADLDRAESACRELAAILERDRSHELQYYADLSNLAEVLTRRNKFAEAVQLLNQVIAALKEGLAEEPSVIEEHLDRAKQRLQQAQKGPSQPQS